MKNKIYITILGLIALFTVHQTSAQLTPMSIGNIDAGDSIMIYYSVKINDPLPGGTTQISSQGVVSGSNITTSNTDDPDTGPLGDATVTPLLNNQPPVFANGASTSITVCTGQYFSLGTALAVNDPDAGQMLIWTVSTGATNGTLDGFTSKTPSNGGTTNPPNAGYTATSGTTDQFVIDVTDGNATAQITVNVTIHPAPAVTCPNNVTVSNDAGQCGANVTYPAATGTGTITYDYASGSFFPVGVTTVKATSTTGCGTTSCMFTVTVNDTTKPAVSCPANISVATDEGICGATVYYALPGITDNCCTPPTSVAGLNYLGTYNGHSYFKNPTALSWNDANNAALAKGGRLVSVADAAETSFLVSVIDDGGWIGGFQNHDNGGYSEPSGGWEWQDGTPFTYTNWAGGEPNNSAVEDAMMIYNGSGQWNDANHSALLYSYVEFVCGKLNLTSGSISGSVFPVGVNTVTYTATDSSGNTSTCSFNVTVTDNEKPAFASIDTAHLSVSIYNPSYADETAFNLKDDDGNYLLSAGGLTRGGTSNFGPVTSINGPYTFTISTIGFYNDNIANYTVYCNNAVATSGTITGGNTIAVPVSCGSRTSTCPADVIVNAPSGQCGTTASWTAPTAIDNCSVQSVTSSHNPGDFFPGGTTEVIYVATDIHGLKDTCRFNVIVNGGSPPDDGNICTTDGCDPATGNPTHTPVNTDDGNPCTADGCDPVSGVYHNPITNTISVGPITGTPTVSCVPLQAHNNKTYTIPAVAGATYLWSVPSGMVIAAGQGTNSITVNMSQAAIHVGIKGQLCVSVEAGCDSGGVCTPIELQYVKPVTPGTITGPTKVCPGDVVTWSVNPVNRASYYVWTLPANTTPVGSTSGNSVTVTVNAGYVNSTISVKAGNICGASTARIQGILVNTPGVPGAITGDAFGVCGRTAVIYSTAGTANATSYHWTVPAGATIANGQGTNSIEVDFTGSYTTGSITVKGVNGCGMGAQKALTVAGKTQGPGLITGPTAVCSGQTYHYSIASVPYANSYSWSKPTGSTLTGQGTTDVDITFGPAATNQVVSVRAVNACGTSAPRTLSGITVSNCTRVGDADVMNEIRIYPNPASHQITVSYTATGAADMVLTLSDILGRKIISNSTTIVEGLNTYLLDLNKVAGGLYMLKLESAGKTTTIKVEVEK